MTHICRPAPPPVLLMRRRVWNAVRLHLANPWPTLIVPWLVFAAVFTLNLLTWYIITLAAGDTRNLSSGAFDRNGGVTWVLVFLTVMAVQAMSLTFRFALGIGMTRRDYYIGTVAYLAFLASTYAAGIVVLAQIERLTNGWGLGGRFFAPWFLADLPAWQLWYLNMVAGMLLAMLGVAAGAVQVRWKTPGLYLFIGGISLLMVAAVWLMTVTESWGNLGAYLANHSSVALATWTLPVTALCGVCGYLVIRRATPRA